MQVTLIRGRGIEPSINKIARTLATHGYSVKLLIWDRDGTAEPYNTALYPTYKCTLRAPYRSTGGAAVFAALVGI